MVFASAYGSIPRDNTKVRRGATKFIVYGQCPGLQRRKFGAIQSRKGGLRSRPLVSKITVYPVNDHVIRAHGRFQFRSAETIVETRKNVGRVVNMTDTIYSPRNARGMRAAMCGIRVEVRVTAVTAEEARDYVHARNLCDLVTLFEEAGQYQEVPTEGPLGREGNRPALRECSRCR